MYITEEPDEYELLQDRAHAPKMIPLDMLFEETDESEPEKNPLPQEAPVVPQLTIATSPPDEPPASIPEVQTEVKRSPPTDEAVPKIGILSSLGIEIKPLEGQPQKSPIDLIAEVLAEPIVAIPGPSEVKKEEPKTETDDSFKINIPSDIQNLLENLKKQGLIKDPLEETATSSTTVSSDELPSIFSKLGSILPALQKPTEQKPASPVITQETQAYVQPAYSTQPAYAQILPPAQPEFPPVPVVTNFQQPVYQTMNVGRAGFGTPFSQQQLAPPGTEDQADGSGKVCKDFL